MSPIKNFILLKRNNVHNSFDWLCEFGTMFKIDENDTAILEELRTDARASTRSIARKVGLPITTVHNRIKRLEREGVIRGYTAVVDHGALGLSVTARVLVTFAQAPGITQADVARAIIAIGADRAEIVTGGSDLLVHLRVASIDELNDFIVRKLRAVAGVGATQTMIVLSSFQAPQTL